VEPRPRVTFWVFVLLASLFVLTSSGRVRTPDEYMTFFQTESLVTHGTTAVPQAVRAGNFYGKVDPRGEPRAPYPPGQAIAAAPFYLLGATIARLPGVPAHARWAALRAGVCFSSAIFAAAAAALFFSISWRLSGRAGAALLATAALALATPILPYAGYFFSEPLAILLLMAAAYGLLTAPRDAPLGLARALVAGVCLGAAVWVRFTHVLALPVFAVALAAGRPRDRRYAVVLLASGTLLVLGVLAYNHGVWGHPFASGYPPNAEDGRNLNSFHTPWHIGLYGFLLSPGKSIVLFAPPLLFALWALPSLRRREGAAFVTAVLMPIAYLLLFMSYTQWDGGYCVGPRYLLPTIPFLCLAVAPGLTEGGPRARTALLTLAVVGLMVQASSAATSFLEDQATPLRYYDAAWNYQLGYAPLISQTRLLWGYLTAGAPAAIGLGFDRWFVLLSKAGVDTRTIAAMLLVPAAGLVTSTACLRREWRRLPPS
jgi:hypothetical protein